MLKPLFGSRGRGLRLIHTAADLPDKETVAGVYYLQEYIPSEKQYARDWRVMVIGGEAVAAMERRADQWVTKSSPGCDLSAGETECGSAEFGRGGSAGGGRGLMLVIDIIRTIGGEMACS